MFDRMGWSGVAAATPAILLWGGAAFFTSCLVYQHVFATHAASAAAAVAAVRAFCVDAFCVAARGCLCTVQRLDVPCSCVLDAGLMLVKGTELVNRTCMNMLEHARHVGFCKPFVYIVCSVRCC